MINDAVNLSYIRPYYGNDVIYVGDGNTLPITHTRDVNIVTRNHLTQYKEFKFQRCSCGS